VALYGEDGKVDKDTSHRKLATRKDTRDGKASGALLITRRS
jgi:hypothetical protein